MSSIQRRLSFGLIGVLIVVAFLFLQSSLWFLERGLRHYLENDLRQETEVLLAALVREASGITLDQRRLSSNYHQPFSGYYFRVAIADETLRSRSAWDHLLPIPVTAGLQASLSEGPQAQQLLVYRADYQRFGKALIIIVAQDYTPILQSFRRIQWLALSLAGLGLLVVLILQRIIVTHAFRPLNNVRMQIAQLQKGQRMELDSQVPDELQALVQQINLLLMHTEATLKRSRNALGNLGHALKTPLAVLTSINARAELKALPAIQTDLRTQLDFIQRRVVRELARARLAGEALPGDHFDCATELPPLFATLEMIHKRSLNLLWQAAPGLRLPWDREDLLELLGNLLDNACKWAESRVLLNISTTTDGFLIEVEDDGPGIDREQREEVLNRGARLDEQVDGHGLGFGIVSDIVHHCHGTMTLDDSALGGLQVVINLPDPRLSRVS